MNYAVGAVGIGPTTSFLSGTRSTTELRTHKIILFERLVYM